jgi:hypothetical protein
MVIHDAYQLRQGDRVQLRDQAISVKRLGPHATFTVRTVDGPRLSPWIETTCGARVAPWEVDFVATAQR